MSSKYIEESNIQLSAEEIAAVLADTYFDGGVVQNKVSGGENKKHEEAESESERNIRRRQRIQEMRRRKRQQELMRKLIIPCAVVFVICIVLAGTGIHRLVRKQQNIKQAGIVNTGNSGQNNIDTGVPVQRETDTSEPDQNDTQTASFEQNSVETTNSEQSSAKAASSEQSSTETVSYSSLNVAGCYIDNAIADSIGGVRAQIQELAVHTLGGKNNNPPLSVAVDESTSLLSYEVVSGNGILIDVEAGKILGQREAKVRISPASMTKILTVLVAAEHITDLDDTFEITQEITDYSYVNGCTNAGFAVGEKVTVRDLFYGTVLPSGAEAAVGLAVYVSGSQEAFVELMNEKIDELGLSETSHFTNCVGLYDENHYSTVYDIAVMLKAACDNSFCREVLSARTYTTSYTKQHPEGVDISNWFLRRIEDKDTHGEVLCAKTGYVPQSGNCAASLSIGKNGKEYICVTAHSNSTWRCIYDHVAICQQFLPE